MTQFIFCIDGGGSKTLLQVVNARGRFVSLMKDGQVVYSVESGASNINGVKKEGVRASLSDLFKDLKVGRLQKDFQEILPVSRVVAGMAGVGIPENFAAVTSLFEEIGVQRENLQLFTDAELALKLVRGNGVVLIAGTGSICFVEKDGVRQRVGGLGRILGDEGSGYQIGLQAIRASLQEEYGYGTPTSLTPLLKDFFQVTELKSLFPQINSLEMSAGTIASVSLLVFEQASEYDPVAIEIINRAASELRQLVSTALKISQVFDCELHLWGGVFKSHFIGPIIEKLKEETDYRGITIVNKSSENAAVLFARGKV